MKSTMTPTCLPAWSFIETSKFMKTKLTLFKILILLFGTLATTTVFGATQIWTGGGDGVDIDAAANWGGTVPTSNAGDVGEWNGVPSGNLLLTHNSSGPLNSGTPGISFYLTASQTGSVNISSRVAASANIAMNGITLDSGAGAFSLGDGTANVLNIILRPSSSGGPPNSPIHVWANNSTTPVAIFPNVRWQSGGGNPHVVQIDGTGDWIVNSTLCMANGPATFFVKTNTGTWFWSANSIPGAAPTGVVASPIDLEGGRLVITANSSLLNSQRITNNNATLQYDAGAAQTLSGPINGTGGILRVSSGTLTLSSGQSDFSGNIQLTNSGVLVAGGTQNATTGPLGTNTVTISFNGGTLQFSAANAFDYSSRFSTAANQAYKFDTAAQNVTFANALTSSGGTLTKLGSGVLALAGANTYGGLTAVGGGKLLIQGSAGSGAIIVSNSTALGVNQGGTQIAPSSLTVGTSGSGTLEFNNVFSTTTAAIASSGAVSAGGPITVNVNSGVFLIGQHYPLFSWGSGNPPAVTLGTLVGAGGNLSTNGNTIQLNVTSLAFVWSGLNNDNWDNGLTPNNWKVNGTSQLFANGGTALFDDTVTTANTNITLNSAVSPASVTVNNSTKPYSITSSGANLISGNGGLTKNGNSTLTLSGGVNTYSGATIVSGGVLSVGALTNGSSPSDIGAAGNSAANLVLNGGALQYTGGAQDSDRLFTLGTGNGTLDSSGSGALNLTNAGSVALSGAGARTLTLIGTDTDDNTLAAVLSDNGGATSLAKSGAGKWVLTGNNTNSGAVTIAAGTLQVGNGGASGAIGSGNITDNGSLMFNTSGTVTNGTIVGTGSVTVDGGGTIILPGNNNYTGATTINAGTLQIGNGGATGALTGGGAVVDNGTLIINTASTVGLNGLFGGGIGGSGNVIVRKGTLQAIGNNSYTGWTQIDPGATFQPSFGNQGLLASSVVTNNGTLLLSRQDNAVFTYSGNIVGSGSLVKICNNGNNGDVTFNGNNTYTGGTYIIGGTIIFGDNSTPGAGSFVGNVFLTNDYIHNQFGTAPNDFVPATLNFNRPDDFTFPGNIVGEGFVTLSGSGVVTLTGNNTYTNRGTGATTTINAGTLQVGNGGTSGSIGTGSIVNNNLLVFNRSDSVTISRTISGAGSLVQLGSGTLTLAANNTYTGATTVSNGTLITLSSSVAGALDAYGGTLIKDGVGLVGTLNVAGALNISSGTIVATLNKSLSPSNTTYVVSGAISSTGGTLALTNVGPNLVAGDTFAIFNQPVTGTALTLQSTGFTVQDNGDGSYTVTSVVVSNPTITATVSGGVLNLAWPSGTGLHLQAQTNSVNVGLSTNWVNVGGVSGNSYSTTANPANGAVFYRLSQ